MSERENGRGREWHVPLSLSLTLPVVQFVNFFQMAPCLTRDLKLLFFSLLLSVTFSIPFSLLARPSIMAIKNSLWSFCIFLAGKEPSHQRTPLFPLSYHKREETFLKSTK